MSTETAEARVHVDHDQTPDGSQTALDELLDQSWPRLQIGAAEE